MNQAQIRCLKKIAYGTLNMDNPPWPALYYLQRRGFITIQGNCIELTPTGEMIAGES